jgi:hypothetical protein
MKAKLLIVAGLALAISSLAGGAQADWRERMYELREDCANGDDRACEHLGRLRREHEEWEREQRFGDAPPPPPPPPVILRSRSAWRSKGITTIASNVSATAAPPGSSS